MGAPCPLCGSTRHVEDLTLGPELRMHFLHRCACCDHMFGAGPEIPDPVQVRPGPGDLSSVRLRTAAGEEYRGPYALWLFELGHTSGGVAIHRDRPEHLPDLDLALKDMMAKDLRRLRAEYPINSLEEDREAAAIAAEDRRVS